MTDIVSFTRVSMDTQMSRDTQMSSLENQKKIINEYISVNKFKLKKEFQVIGKSNETLLECIEYCNKNKCDLVISHSDRLTRNMSEFKNFLNLLKDIQLHMVKTITLKDSTIKLNNEGTVMGGILTEGFKQSLKDYCDVLERKHSNEL